MLLHRKDIAFALLMGAATAGALAFRSVSACRIAVGCILLLCIVRGLWERELLNPYLLFSLTPLSLLVYRNLGSRYMLDLTAQTWLLAAVNMAAFLLALCLTPPYKRPARADGHGEGRPLLLTAFGLTALGLLPDAWRAVLGSPMPLASVFSLLTVPGLLCALKSKLWPVIAAVIGLLVLDGLFFITKTTLLMLLLGLLIGFEKYFALPAGRRSGLIALIAVCAAVMLLSFSFANQDRGGTAETAAYYTESGEIAWSGAPGLLMPYLYFTTPWTNLQYVMQTQPDRTFGLWMLKPLIGYLQLDGLLSSRYVLRAYSGFNTFSFAANGFKDFGLWGSWFSSVFLGFFVKKVYSRYTLSPSPLDAACYALSAQGVLEMFFSNEFYMQSFPFTIVIVLELWKLLFCREAAPERSEGGCVDAVGIRDRADL